MKMKKYSSLYITAIIVLSILGSCAEDPFYAVPIEFNSAQTVFSDSARAEYFINNAYTEQPSDVSSSFNWLAGNAMLASACDEAMHVQSNKTSPSTASKMSAGNWGPSNMQFYRSSDGAGEIGSWMKWGGYHGVRKSNTAIKYLDLLPATCSQRFKNRLKGEAHFLRGLQHFHLFQKWGGIPIVDKAFEASDDVQISRNTLEETVNFICNEFDQAIELLPEDPYLDSWEIGRADRGACYAYKARVLLYAASKLYNGPGMDGSGNPLICYGTYDANRWKLAAEAAQKVIDLNWYTLYTNGTNGQENYKRLFNEWGSGHNNHEFIFGRIRGTNRDTENDNFPAGFTNSKGGTCPSQDLVDAYEMSDGTLFDWNDPEKAATPYENRDPRFYASIIYNGAHYNKFANASNYTFQTYTGGKNATGNTATETSYYLYKFMDYEKCKPDAKSGGAYHVWMDMRYAEVLLNYAEAANEYGGPNFVVNGASRPITPIEALNQIRERSGMPDVATTFKNRGKSISKESLREFIYHERQIEMAFENQRYYDIRRWMLIESLPQYIRGCKITIEDGKPVYDPTIIVENKIFERKHYFFPIPQVEINRNINMVQNPEW
ncbi:RagB/SusD family nutrient uptake outer membrane protein [Parabacteroides sp. AM08-6]|nr:RagB/SusD family nutrient uptake outer membrane protein [Parabacteroides sp. AM08-6]